MRARGACARGGAPGFKRQNGFLFGNACGEVAEIRRVLDRFHVKENLPDVVHVFPVFNRGLGVHIGLVADGDELRKADVEILKDIENAAT